MDVLGRPMEVVEGDDMLRPGQIQAIGPGYSGEHLVRIGVLGDGNCLLHSVLHAVSAEYRAADADRKQMAKAFRAELRLKVRRLIEVAFVVNSFCRDKAEADPLYKDSVLAAVAEVERVSMSQHNPYHGGPGDLYENRVFYKCGATKIHKDCAILIVLKALQFPLMNEIADVIQGQEIPIELGPVIAKALPDVLGIPAHNMLVLNSRDKLADNNASSIAAFDDGPTILIYYMAGGAQFEEGEGAYSNDGHYEAVAEGEMTIVEAEPTYTKKSAKGTRRKSRSEPKLMATFEGRFIFDGTTLRAEYEDQIATLFSL
uniref:OTU domain-containing protein n=1 Tax=viral metagenome TaxID=1070528 RepID=A0A6C0E567_9ZZZZ